MPQRVARRDLGARQAVTTPTDAAQPSTAGAPRPAMLWWVRVRRCVRRCSRWDSVLNLALVLWIARIPVIMTSLGCLLFWKSPQAQDLFLEFAMGWSWPGS